MEFDASMLGVDFEDTCTVCLIYSKSLREVKGLQDCCKTLKMGI